MMVIADVIAGKTHRTSFVASVWLLRDIKIVHGIDGIVCYFVWIIHVYCMLVGDTRLAHLNRAAKGSANGINELYCSEMRWFLYKNKNYFLFDNQSINTIVFKSCAFSFFQGHFNFKLILFLCNFWKPNYSINFTRLKSICFINIDIFRFQSTYLNYLFSSNNLMNTGKSGNNKFSWQFSSVTIWHKLNGHKVINPYSNGK